MKAHYNLTSTPSSTKPLDFCRFLFYILIWNLCWALSNQDNGSFKKKVLKYGTPKLSIGDPTKNVGFGRSRYSPKGPGISLGGSGMF